MKRESILSKNTVGYELKKDYEYRPGKVWKTGFHAPVSREKAREMYRDGYIDKPEWMEEEKPVMKEIKKNKKWQAQESKTEL